MILLYLLAIATALTIGAILAGIDHDEAARVEALERTEDT